MMKPLNITPAMENSDISYKLADFKSYNFDNYLMNKYNLKNNKEYLTTESKEKLSLPYGNAGFILISKYYFNGGFTQKWIDTAIEIYSDNNIKNKFPWLDQISLVITVLNTKGNLCLIDEIYNYPFHAYLKLKNDTIFCHYHHIDNYNKYLKEIDNDTIDKILLDKIDSSKENVANDKIILDEIDISKQNNITHKKLIY